MESIRSEEREANELLQAQAHLWNSMLSFLKSMSLKCAIDLGIPDAIHDHGGPITLPDLVAALAVPSTKADSVRRIMRLLVYYGLFAMRTAGGQESYVLTPSSRLLLKDERACISPFIQMLLNPYMWERSHYFLYELRYSPQEASEKTLWEKAGKESEFNEVFNEGMASDARLVAEVIRRSSGDVFRGVRSLVDVGGGTGAMALAIAEAFPEVKCTVLDLPHVIASAPKNTVVDFMGGDMFEHIPKSDAILLKSMLHAWSDEECIKILKRCKEAIPSKGDGGKVIIIDIVLGTSTNGIASVETQFLFDLEMMSLSTGKERDEGEWKNIFFAADFSDYKIKHSLGVRSIIELYP